MCFKALSVLFVATALLRTAAGQFVDSSAAVVIPTPPASYHPGAAWGDVNGDGWDDLYVSNYYGPNHLYLNLPGPPGGPARVLVDSTPVLLADPAGHGEGVALADFDNDGDVDMYVVNAGGASNHLYANVGGGSFVDVTAASGLGISVTGEGCAVADVDGDGLLDIFLLTYGTTAGEPDHLYKNLGGLVFTDATAAVGLTLEAAFGGACAFADFDLDGDPDLFIGNDGSANHFYENVGGTFVETITAALAGAALADPAGGCFGVRWVDADADGDMDLYLSNSSAFVGASSTNRYYRNEVTSSGARTLTFVPMSGAADTGEGMAVTSGDLDLDGDQDLAIANFGPTKIYLGGVGSPATVSVTGSLFAPAPAGYFAELFSDTSSAVTRCDYDHDGDLDLVVCGSVLRFYRNDAVGSGAFSAGVAAKRSVSVRFSGDASAPYAVPRDGHGTRARPVISSGSLVYGGPAEQVDGGSGYAQDAPSVAWSLGTAGAPKYLQALDIEWANGVDEHLFGLTPPGSPVAAAPHRQIQVTYPAGITAYAPASFALTAPRLWRSSATESFGTCSAGNPDFALAAEGLPASGTAYLAVGLAPASVPMPGGTLLVDALLVLTSPIAGGSAKWPLPIPSGAGIVGLAVHAQCAAVDGITGGIAWSNALLMVIQP